MEFVENVKIQLKNGCQFEGNLNVKFEKGKMIYPNGEVYEGSFMGSKKHGNGKLNCKNGVIQNGKWVNDKFFGNGSITYPNGDIIIFVNPLDKIRNIIITKKKNTKSIRFTVDNKVISEINIPDFMSNINNINDLEELLKNNIEENTDDLEEFEKEDIKCPISLSLMVDPIVTSCNHAFCRIHLENYFNKYNKNCPVCRETILYMIPNDYITDMLKKVKFNFLDAEISYSDFLNFENIKYHLEKHNKHAESFSGGNSNQNNTQGISSSNHMNAQGMTSSNHMNNTRGSPGYYMGLPDYMGTYNTRGVMMPESLIFTDLSNNTTRGLSGPPSHPSSFPLNNNTNESNIVVDNQEYTDDETS